MTEPPEEEDVQMKIIQEAGFLQDVVDALDALVDEAKFQFLDELIRIRVVDSANVAMCFMDIRPSERDQIQHYSVQDEGMVQGLDLNRLDDVLGYADADDLLQIEFGEKHNWRFNLTLPSVDVNISGIDPESIRREPDDPGLDLPAKFRLNGSSLKDAVDLNDMFSDHSTIRVEDHSVKFIGQGDTDDGTFELAEGDGELEFISTHDDPAESMVSMDYLKDISKVLKGYDEVTMEVGIEFPVVFKTDLFEMTVAPRIDSMK